MCKNKEQEGVPERRGQTGAEEGPSGCGTAGVGGRAGREGQACGWGALGGRAVGGLEAEMKRLAVLFPTQRELPTLAPNPKYPHF